MKDTSNDILKMQQTIFLAKPVEERFVLALRMIDDGIQLCKNGIKNSWPDVSENELKIELFKRLYKDDFSKKELDNITNYLGR